MIYINCYASKKVSTANVAPPFTELDDGDSSALQLPAGLFPLPSRKARRFMRSSSAVGVVAEADELPWPSTSPPLDMESTM